jgi:RNA polymerase sigma factor (sigma-70 family)
MPEDRDVLRQIKAGDIDRYGHLVDAYEPAIRRYIRTRLFDRDHTDDLVQLVFIKFYKSIGLFDDSRPVLPYLYAIAITELKMFFRAQKKGKVSLEQVEHTLESEQVGDIVLDPFTGSSTTGIASAINDRKFIGIDLEKKYLDLSVKRFNDLKK